MILPILKALGLQEPEEYRHYPAQDEEDEEPRDIEYEVIIEREVTYTESCTIIVTVAEGADEDDIGEYALEELNRIGGGWDAGDSYDYGDERVYSVEEA